MKTAKKVSKVERELLDATGAKGQKTGEDRQKYLVRLTRAAHKMDEKKWEELSTEAQSFVNLNIKRLNDKKAAKDFDEAGAKPAKAAEGAKAKDEEDEDEEDDDEDEDEEDDDDEDEEDEDEEDEDEEDDDDEDEEDEDEEDEDEEDDEDDDDEDEDEEDDEDDDDEDEEDEDEEDDEDDEDDEDEEDEDEEDEDEEDDEDDDKESAKKPAAKSDKGASNAVRDAIIANPGASKEAIAKIVKKGGVKVAEGTLNIVYYDTVGVISKLEKAGRLKPADKAEKKKSKK